MKWTYDSNVDAAYITVGDINNSVKTLDLNDSHVMLDFDLDGNLIGVEIIAGDNITLRDLKKYLKRDPDV